MKGFKQFLLSGNVVDMAVGIVIGAAHFVHSQVQLSR